MYLLFKKASRINGAYHHAVLSTYILHIILPIAHLSASARFHLMNLLLIWFLEVAVRENYPAW